MTYHWIKLSDQEPPIGEPVLVTEGKLIMVMSRTQHGWNEQEGWCVMGHDWLVMLEQDNITHWMPLPELPWKEPNTSFEDDTRPYADDEIGLDTDSA